MRKDGVWGGCKELLAAVELWNLRIVVVRPGHATVLVGKGEIIEWLKLESRHCELLASDNSEEFRAARGAHIKEIAKIYKVAFSKLDSVKDDCVKDLDGGAAVACLLKVPPVLVPLLVCSIKQKGKGDVFQGHFQCLFVVGV